MIKKILTCIFLCIPSLAYAQSQESPKAPRSFVTDGANILNSQTKQSINAIAARLLADKDVPLYVITIPSLATYRASEYGIAKYSRMVFDKWGLGWKNHNYGILLLVSAGDKEARIEFGADWNHKYDSEAAYIMDKLMVPEFKKGDYSKGIFTGAKALNATVRGMDLPKRRAFELPLWAIFLIAVSILLLISSLFRSGKKGWAWAVIIALGVFVIFFMNIANKTGLGGGSGGGGGSSGKW